MLICTVRFLHSAGGNHCIGFITNGIVRVAVIYTFCFAADRSLIALLVTKPNQLTNMIIIIIDTDRYVRVTHLGYVTVFLAFTLLLSVAAVTVTRE